MLEKGERGMCEGDEQLQLYNGDNTDRSCGDPGRSQQTVCLSQPHIISPDNAEIDFQKAHSSPLGICQLRPLRCSVEVVDCLPSRQCMPRPMIGQLGLVHSTVVCINHDSVIPRHEIGAWLIRLISRHA